MPSDAEDFAKLMQRYMQVSSRLPAEIMRRTAVDLGFKLRAGFYERRWGKGDRSVAWAAFMSRASIGKGITLRPSYLKEYLAMKETGKLSKSFKRSYRHFIRGGGRKGITAWQLMVRRELNLRTTSIGSLASSFAWRDRRNSRLASMLGVSPAKSKGKRGHLLGYLQLEEDRAKIVAVADVGGEKPRPISEIDERFGISAGAIATVRAEKVEHIRKEHLARYREIFKQDPH